MSAKAHKESSLFRQSVGVVAKIDAPVEKVWALLTDGGSFPDWNSTVVSLEGTIAEGEKIKLKVTSSDREFNLLISGVQTNRSMTWSDGFAPMFRGVRTFELESKDEGVEFRMVEVLSGLMLPMIKGSLPDFVPIFEQYAADLKKAAEA